MIRGPVASVTCFDADRPDLPRRLRRAVAEAGLDAPVTASAGTDDTVVVVELAVGDLGLGPVDGGDGWASLSQRLGRVLDEVAPTIALGGFSPVLDLDEPVWRIDRLQWCSGRVDVSRLDADRVAAFNALAGDRLVEVRDGAVRWAVPPGVPLGVGLLDVTPLALAAATYEAWTGEAADLEPVADDVDEVNTPVLWLWDHDTDALAEAVRSALPSYDVTPDDDHGPLGPVAAAPPPGRDALADLLDDLRSAVTAGAPAWAGVLPRGGFLPPGVAPELPAASVVDHLWLREDWAGPALPAIEELLAGVDPEPIGAGRLLVTGPDPRSDDVEMTWTPMVRYGMLVRVADVLGRRVAEDLDGSDVVI